MILHYINEKILQMQARSTIFVSIKTCKHYGILVTKSSTHYVLIELQNGFINFDHYNLSNKITKMPCIICYPEASCKFSQEYFERFYPVNFLTSNIKNRFSCLSFKGILSISASGSFLDNKH